jgi:hypothetical protein
MRKEAAELQVILHVFSVPCPLNAILLQESIAAKDKKLTTQDKMHQDINANIEFRDRQNKLRKHQETVRTPCLHRC